MKQDSAHTTPSIAIKGWITWHPALAFYVLTLTFSWGYWFSLLAQGLHFGGLGGDFGAQRQGLGESELVAGEFGVALQQLAPAGFGAIKQGLG